jgi:seryl-tRNA synthetase
MIDINLLRDDVDGVASLLKKRGFDLDTTAFLRLEAARKKMQVRTQELQ